MDALCSMSSYCLALAPVLGGNYCSFNFSPFSFFYRTEPKVSSSLSFSPERYILSDQRPKSQVLCLHRALHDHANIKKPREYWCSVAFFLFTDAIIWPQRQHTSPQIPVVVASHLIKTRLAHMFLWQVSSSLCTGDELWICTPYGPLTFSRESSYFRVCSCGNAYTMADTATEHFAHPGLHVV